MQEELDRISAESISKVYLYAMTVLYVPDQRLSTLVKLQYAVLSYLTPGQTKMRVDESWQSRIFTAGVLNSEG